MTAAEYRDNTAMNLGIAHSIFFSKLYQGIHEIRALLENYWGHISRQEVQYIFGLSGFLTDTSELDKLKNGVAIPVKIKAKMFSLKLYNRLFFNMEDEMSARQVVRLIKEHTGKELPLSEAYLDRYGY